MLLHDHDHFGKHLAMSSFCTWRFGLAMPITIKNLVLDHWTIEMHQPFIRAISHMPCCNFPVVN